MGRVLVTGASGFIGRRLAEALLDLGSLHYANTGRQPIRTLCVVDRETPRMPAAADGIEIEAVGGDLSDPVFVNELAARQWDSIFHLAASLTLDAKRDPDRAFAVNVEALRKLMHRGKNCPRLVFASSIAVFGGALPEVVDDDVLPGPQTTYGTHKAVAELLIADHSRNAMVDGRALRLPIVLTRPAAPTPTVSDQVASIIREPLAGHSLVVPLKPETVIPVASVGAVVSSLVRLHDLPASELPQSRAMNLPSLSVTIADMVTAVSRRMEGDAGDHFQISPDPNLQGIVDSWPRHLRSAVASALGLGADDDFEGVIQDHLDHVAKVAR